MDFGQYIKGIRKEKGLSIRELSKQSGISHPYLSQLENKRNKNPSPDILEKLAKGLGLDFYSLWIIFSKSVQNEYIQREKEERKEAAGKAMIEALKNNEEEIITVNVPRRIEYSMSNNQVISKITTDKDLFDLYYLLHMDKPISFKEKELNGNDKSFILNILERTLLNKD